MITVNRPLYSNIPEAVRKAVISWQEDHIDIDETLLTAQQIVRLKAFLATLGYT